MTVGAEEPCICGRGAAASLPSLLPPLRIHRAYVTRRDLFSLACRIAWHSVTPTLRPLGLRGSMPSFAIRESRASVIACCAAKSNGVEYCTRPTPIARNCSNESKGLLPPAIWLKSNGLSVQLRTRIKRSEEHTSE